MSFNLFDYCDANGVNQFKEWAKKLQTPQRAKLNAKLDMLSNQGSELFPDVLTGTDTPGILKLRVKGNVQLRPMLCDGPVNINKEYTLLLGAIEVGDELKPKNADKLADKRKNEVKLNPNTRRVKHERIC